MGRWRRLPLLAAVLLYGCVSSEQSPASPSAGSAVTTTVTAEPPITVTAATSEVPGSSPVDSPLPLLRPIGQLPDDATLTRPADETIPRAIDADGWGIRFEPITATDEADPCHTRLVLRSPQGTETSPGVEARCPVGLDSNSVDERWIVWIDAPTPELEIAAGWRLLAFDRLHQTVTVITEPDRGRIPVEAVSLDGNFVAWHELGADGASSQATWHSYVVDLESGRRTDLGEGVVSPIVRAPNVFASRLSPASRDGRLVRFRLSDGAPMPWIEAMGAPLAATSSHVLTLSDGRGLLVDFDGRRVAELDGVLLYPVASSHLMTWAVAVDSLTSRLQLLDTRCLALFDVGDVELQGVFGEVAGEVFTWTSRVGAEPVDGAGEYHQLDVSTADLCGR